MYDITTYGASTGAADNSSAINAATLAAYSAGGGDVLVPAGRWKVQNSVIAYAGVRLVGEGQVIYSYSGASISGGSIIEVDHTGIGIFLQESATVDNIGFDYPGQSAASSSPTTYGATIQLAGNNGNYDQKVTRCWFHKAYLALDLRGSVKNLGVGGLVVEDNEGSPIFPAALDFVVDWTSIRNNKFNAGKMNPTGLTTGLVAWCASNAIGIQLGGNDWVTLDGWETWGYGTGAEVIPGSGYAASGPYTFVNCSFDASVTGIQLTANAAYNQPVRILNCAFAPFNNTTGARGAAVAGSNGIDTSNGGLIMTGNYVFGPFYQMLWCANASQNFSNIIIAQNIANAGGGGDQPVAITTGSNIQVVDNIFRGFVGGINVPSGAIVANNQT